VGPRRVRPRTALITLTCSLLTRLAWQIPVAFEATVREVRSTRSNTPTWLATACASWWAALARGTRRRCGAGFAIVEVVTVSALMSVLGALLVFSPTLSYPSYGSTEIARGSDSLRDQQAAGLMGIPASLIYPVIQRGCSSVDARRWFPTSYPCDPFEDGFDPHAQRSRLCKNEGSVMPPYSGNAANRRSRLVTNPSG
jgi:hypothetical protein